MFTLLRIACAVGIIFYLSPLRDPEQPPVTATEAVAGLGEALSLLPESAQERILSEIAAAALAHGSASRAASWRDAAPKASIQRQSMDAGAERQVRP